MSERDLISDSFDFPVPAEGDMTERFNLWATHYYVHKARATDDGEPFLDTEGNELGPKLPAREWCLAAIEGTAEIEDSSGGKTVYNYAGMASAAQVDCARFFPGFGASGKLRWKLANGPYGDGIYGMILRPFRTIAVDSKQTPIPYRSVIYIPAARGVRVTLPSGTIAAHDGYFYSADTGGKIKNEHIDVFGGNSDINPFPNFIKNRPAPTFEAFLIANGQIAGTLARLHQI